MDFNGCPPWSYILPMSSTFPREGAGSRSSQLERITRAEERAHALHSAIEALRDDFKGHAKDMVTALRSLQDESQQRKGAERERHWWTAAIVGFVSLAVNVAIKLI